MGQKRRKGESAKRAGRRAPRRRRRLVVWIERGAWALMLGFIAWRVWPQAAAALGAGDSSGERAPEVRVQTLSGDRVALSSLKGQVVLVNFWATWCPPCRFEMPGFQAVYERYHDRGFTILGLSTDQGVAGQVEAFVSARGITYPVGMASYDAQRAFGGVNLLPTSFLIDKRGRIRYRVQGIFAQAALQQAVERLLAEQGPVAVIGSASGAAAP